MKMNVTQKWYIFLFVVLNVVELHHCRRVRVGSHVSRPVHPTSRVPSRGFTTPRRHFSTSRNVPTSRRPITSRPSGTRKYNVEKTTHRPFDSPPNPGWNLPPRPGPHDFQKPNKVKIVNNYHYPGYVPLPTSSQYPGYYQPSTHYHYTSHDTGNTALGFFLGYGLGRLTTPTYTHHTFFDGYVPRYDHYTVHHYYHGKDSVEKEQNIPSNTIVGCVGNTSDVCPGNTTALCTSNGVLMCVVSATSTVPCTEDRTVNCIKSVISCVNDTAPECRNANNTLISIPCVSNAKIYGDIKFVNRTIIAGNATDSINKTTTDNNSTNSTVETFTTTTPQYSTRYPITTTPPSQTTTNDTLTSPQYYTKYPITTTPPSQTTTNVTVTSLQYSTKYPITTTPHSQTTNVTVIQDNKIPQNFCVTVIALPAKRQPTKGEILLEESNSLVSKFIENTWGL